MQQADHGGFQTNFDYASLWDDPLGATTSYSAPNGYLSSNNNVTKKKRRRRARKERGNAEPNDILESIGDEGTLQLVVGGSNLVTFGAGFETIGLIPGFNLCAVAVQNLPIGINREQVAEIFEEDLALDRSRFYVAEIKSENGNQKAVVLTRVDDTESIEALALEGIEYEDRFLEFQLGANALWGRMSSSAAPEDVNTLTINWSKPSKTIVLSYSSIGEARRNAQQLDGIMVSGRKVKATLNNPRQANTPSVRLSNLDPTTTSLDLYQFTHTFQVVEEIRSGTHDFDLCVRMFQARLQGFPGMIRGSYQTIVEGTKVQTKARFSSYNAVQVAYDSIEAGNFGRSPLLQPLLPHGHEYIISIPGAQYTAQKSLWDNISEGSAPGREGAFVRITPDKNGRKCIKVLGPDQKELGALKVRVESLVAGDRLDPEHWHSSFLSNIPFLNTVKTSSAAHVSVDRKVQALRVFGTNVTKAAATRMIKREVERLNSLEFSTPLPQKSVSFFVRFGLKNLRDVLELDEEDVSLDLTPSRPPTIRIKGGDDARHYLRQLMDKAAAQGGITARRVAGAPCPICYDDVSVPDTLSCGHTYCEACLRHYLISAADSKTFPLKCMGDEGQCGQSIAIVVIQRYLTPQRFNRLVDVAFSTYLERNARTYKYCTTPDCSQIYECNPNKTTHQCPSCFSKICARCDEEVHQGMTCNEARLHRDNAEQERLNDEWATTNNVKRCPSCRVMIEKRDGCNHMECRCGAHICWICLRVFTQGPLVYVHMQAEHGGYYEQGALPPVVQPARVQQPPARLPVIQQPAVRPPVPPRPIGLPLRNPIPNPEEARLRQVEEDRQLAERLTRQDEQQRRFVGEFWRTLDRQRAQGAAPGPEAAILAAAAARTRREEEEAAAAARRARLIELERVLVAQEQQRAQEEGSWCTIM